MCRDGVSGEAPTGGPANRLVNVAGVCRPYFALWVDNAELLVPFK